MLGSRAVHCIDISSEGEFHAGFRGYAREESAEQIVAGVRAAITEGDATEVVVLTPYRAQRTLIRKKLSKAGIRGVHVSTVHKAQGSEKGTVFLTRCSASTMR